MGNMKPNSMAQNVGNQQNMMGGNLGSVKPLQDQQNAGASSN